MPFFTKLEEEIVSAKLANKAIIIQMDANSKLGKEIVPNNPKEQSQNGKVLAEIVERNALVVANSLSEKCQGLITRKRTTEDGVEESIIDFVIVSADLVCDLKEMIIDEKKEHALTKITRKNNVVNKATSDHNVILTKFHLRVTRKEPMKRMEVLNFKNKNNQHKFREETSKNNKLSKIFETSEDLNIQTELFIKKLNGIMFKCFDKIRIGQKKKSEYETLYEQWTNIRHKEDQESKIKSVDLEDELAEKFADNIHAKISEEIKGLECEEGGLNSGRLWKLKRKLFSNFQDPPNAMKDVNGKVLTEKDEILEATIKHYQKVLENRKIKEGLENHQEDREQLAKIRMKKCQENKSPDWDMNDLEEALKDLKNNKAGDSLGYINELFKPDIIGSDLKLALLLMLNKI